MYDLSDPRYARQLVLRGFGPAAQERLANGRVLIVGAGGLGSPAASYLAAAGVGTISLVDTDVVDVTNLHRQLLYTTPDVGRRKVDVARERLQAINPQVVVHTHDTRLSAVNAAGLVAGHDVVIDATDNFPARYRAFRSFMAAWPDLTGKSACSPRRMVRAIVVSSPSCPRPARCRRAPKKAC